MEKAFVEAIEKAVTGAVEKAIPTTINQNFHAAVDQAVKDKLDEIEKVMEKKFKRKVDEIEKDMEKKLKRATRKAELRENLDAAKIMVGERSRLIDYLPDYGIQPGSKLITGLHIRKDLDSTRIKYFEGALLVMDKEDKEEEEKKKVNEEQV
ncbi:hypothetical protein QM012_004681 [Aureobasidium pullulans]|uniref:Uncharacterized protein n=1 Tax=Aureobasidium pullulans TaxID=5580 RepID=A0ABR0TUU8_AURPU